MTEKNISSSYYAALAALTDRLAARTVDLSHKHIVIVPDRCTLTAERAICSRFGGAFDVDVTTWSRLFNGGAPTGGYLPRQGSVMIVRRILEEKKKELKCYRKSASARGFAAKLYDAISQLAVCEVRPEDVTLGKGGAKAEDIALVYSEYLRLTEGMYCDASGRMRLLKNYLETTDFLKNTTVYVACFDAYTKQMKNIIDVMDRKADRVYVFDTEAAYSFGGVELYSASSPVFAAKAVAARIACDARDGVPYGDICVVTSSARPDEIKRILGENGIPFSAAGTLRLSEHPLGRFLTLALSVPARGYRAADVVRLSKNPFSGVEKEDSDALERYAAKYGITYKLFLSPFSIGAEAEEGTEERELFAGAERARKTVVGMLEECAGGGILSRFESLVNYAEKRYAEKPALSDSDTGRANPFEKARALSSLCASLMGRADDRVLSDALGDGMAATELAARPRLLGAVEIGGERDFRARKFKRVYVADFNTDAHPFITPDSGLISDDDIFELRGKGAELSPTTAEVNRRARDEFFLLLGGAEKVTLVHTDKPGSALDVIKPRAASFSAGGTERDRVNMSAVGTAKEFMRYCPTKNMLTEQYLYARAQLADDGDEPSYYPYAEALVGDGTEKLALPPYPAQEKEAGELMLSDTTKVSQLETYFSCPLKHFFRYGLRLSEPETGELRPLDVGSLLHEVAENYVKVMDSESPETAAARLLENALASSGKAGLDVNKNTISLLGKEAAGLCSAILSQIRAGDFRPAATEQEFGFPGGRLKGAELNVGGRKIVLRGKIDRIDLFGKYARVVDYKTGGVKFSLTDLKSGVKLQLLVYLAVMIKAGYAPAGAFYFSTLNDFDTSQPYKLVGVCANEPEVLAAMDKNILSGESEIMKVKRGRDKKLYVCSGESGEDVKMLAEYALAVSTQAAEEIAEGYIAPSPYGGSGMDACARCEYADACGYDGDKRMPVAASLKSCGEEV